MLGPGVAPRAGHCGLKRLYAEDQVSDGVCLKIICSGIISTGTWIETIVILVLLFDIYTIYQHLQLSESVPPLSRWSLDWLQWPVLLPPSRWSPGWSQWPVLPPVDSAYPATGRELPRPSGEHLPFHDAHPALAECVVTTIPADPTLVLVVFLARSKHCSYRPR
jgi:hypothetical protein